MCGILGIVDRKDVFNALVLGTAAQNYAGEESAGLAVCQKGIKICSDKGLASNVFSELNYRDFRGRKGIAHNSCLAGEILPIELTMGQQRVAFCADTTKETLRKISEIFSGASNPISAVEEVLKKVEHPFSLLLLTNDDIIAARNNGRKPLSYGRYNKSGFYIASQSGVLGVDANFIHSIFPGEMLILNQKGAFRKAILARPDLTRCINEILYFQRPGNICAGRDTGFIRQDIGSFLGKKFATTVLRNRRKKYFQAIAVPEGGRQFAIGFNKTANIATDPAGVVRNRYPKPEWVGDNIDIFPVEYLVKEKQVVLIEDLIRSGRKIQILAERCRNQGAKGVHLVVGSIVRFSCQYGNGSYTGDLVGNKTQEQLIRELKLDSLTTLTTTELLGAINTPHRIYCTECLTN